MELELIGVEKSYNKGKTYAVKNFSVKFTQGVYGLLGANGAGKSTLMNIITQNLKADRGTIAYNDAEIGRLGANYRKKLGYIPQQQGVYDDFTGEKFLWYMSALKGMKKQEAKERIAMLLEVVNLQEARYKKLKSYSGGMKQRVAVARALALEADVLLLDEPFGAVDPKLRLELQELVSRLCTEHNKTVVFVTHDIDEAILLSDRIVVMESGKIRTILSVRLPHPRKRDDLIGTAEYENLHRKLIASFYAHVEDNIDSEVML